MLATLRRFVAAALLLGSGLLASTVSADIICRSPGGIEGFHEEYATATGLLHGTTSDPKRFKVYLTHRGDTFYAHSNFVTDEMITDHEGRVAPNTIPTKLATTKVLSFPVLMMNLLGDEHFTLDEYNRILHSVVVYFDESLAGTKWGDIDFGAADVHVYGDEYGALPSKVFHFPDGRPERLVPLEHVYSRMGDVAEARAALTRLSSTELKRKEIKIVALTTDTATLHELHANASDALVTEPAQSIDAMKDLFGRSKYATFVVLGHFEDGSFKVRDATGKVVAHVALPELLQAAQEADVGIVPLGCYTAGAGTGGAATKFNTLSAAKRLGVALNAANYADFFQGIGGQDLAFVFDSKTASSLPLTEPRPIFFEVYSADATARLRLAGSVGVRPAGRSDEPVDAAGPAFSAGSGSVGSQYVFPPDTTGSDMQGGPLGWMALGGVAVLGLGGFVIYRRRRSRWSLEENS